MPYSVCKIIFLLLAACCFQYSLYSQNIFIISGKVINPSTNLPLPYATVHLLGNTGSTLTRPDGSFYIQTDTWFDTLQITNVGYEPLKKVLEKQHTKNLVLEMKQSSGSLQGVTVSIAKKPGKTFMEKVIEHKASNNPSRFRSYSYQRYTRNELDVDNIDFQNAKGSGLKSLMIKTYDNIDSTAKNEKELPIYFAESIANNYHSVSPNIEREKFCLPIFLVTLQQILELLFI